MLIVLKVGNALELDTFTTIYDKYFYKTYINSKKIMNSEKLY